MKNKFEPGLNPVIGIILKMGQSFSVYFRLFNMSQFNFKYKLIKA